MYCTGLVCTALYWPARFTVVYTLHGIDNSIPVLPALLWQFSSHSSSILPHSCTARTHMANNGKLWKTMGVNGEKWETVRNNGKLWENSSTQLHWPEKTQLFYPTATVATSNCKTNFQICSLLSDWTLCWKQTLHWLAQQLSKNSIYVYVRKIQQTWVTDPLNQWRK